MPVNANLVHQTSTTTGTGSFTLSVVNGKQSFDTAFGHGATTDVFDYYISSRDAAEYERGTGHMSAATTLVRDTVIESTNANAAVNFSAGTKDVVNDAPAGRQKYNLHGADVASSGTINLDTATGDLVDVTGTTSITAITLADGQERTVRFTGILTLTNGASLILPTSANITTAAGDVAVFRGYASSVVRCVDYARLTGRPLTVDASDIATGTMATARLGSGSATASTFLRGDQAYAVPPLGISNSSVITFTRALNAGNGSVTYSGAGFQPTVVIITAFESAGSTASICFAGSSGAGGSLSFNGVGAGAGSISANAVAIAQDADPTVTGQTASLSYTSDGFSLNWTKHGSPPAVTVTLYALCLK